MEEWIKAQLGDKDNKMFIVEYICVGIHIFTLQLSQPFCMFEIHQNKMLGREGKKWDFNSISFFFF